MELALLRFFESLPAALAVGLLLIPLLAKEDGARFKPTIAMLAWVRALLGFGLIVMTARAIIPEDRPIDFVTLWTFTVSTVVGKAWIVTEVIAALFAAAATARIFVDLRRLDYVALGLGVAVIVVVSLTGHAVDDALPIYTQLSFLVHTGAGLTWLGGLLGLLWWMFTARGKPPEVAHELAECWSLVAKIAMGVVVLSGVALAWENVGSFANLLATPYGRLLTLKLTFLCAVLLIALALVRYNSRQPRDAFDTQWYGKTGAIEAGFGLALLFIAGWIAVITPASHENNLYWPLPFRLGYDATWGQKPPMFTPVWWWGVSGLVLLIAGAVLWFTPKLRSRRKIFAPAAAAIGALCIAVSFSVEAYPDTYNDPTQDYTAESVTRGKEDFAANCVACHGDLGEGNGALAKSLKDAKGVAVAPADLTAPHVGTHTIGDLFHWLTFGGQTGVMPAFKEQLDPDDRWDVINFPLMLSYANRSRFLSPQGQIQWLIAPDFALIDPTDVETSLYRLRGTPTLLSFARCGDTPSAELSASLKIAHDSAAAAGAKQVTVFQGKCADAAKAREPVHVKAVENTYSVINRYPNESYSQEISEAHFLIDKSGYVRARFRHFEADDSNVSQLKILVAMMQKEPLIIISLHSH